MITLRITDDRELWTRLAEAPGVFGAWWTATTPFCPYGEVSFLGLDALTHALSLLPTDELIGVPK